MEFRHNNEKMYYETVGEGSPVLIIHGFSLDGDVMQKCMEPIFAKTEGFKRVYVDLPGMGRTPKGGVRSADDMLELLAAFAAETLAGERFSLAGESYGGYLMRGIASRMKERITGMMFLCPMIRSERRTAEKLVVARDDAFMASLPADNREAFEGIATLQTAEYYERYADEIIPAVDRADMDFLNELKKNREFSFDVDEKLGRFEGPALFMLGRQDWWVGYLDAWELAMKSYPRATVAALDCAGHNLQLERVEPFEALTLDFLNRVKRGY